MDGREGPHLAGLGIDLHGIVALLDVADDLVGKVLGKASDGAAHFLGVLATGDHEAHIADDADRGLAAEQGLGHLDGQFLEKIQPQVGAGQSQPRAVFVLDRSVDRGQPVPLALDDVGQGIEHDFLARGPGAQEPGALAHAVGIEFGIFVIDQGLPGDLALFIAVPIGDEPAAGVVAVGGVAGELAVPAVQGIGVPGGIRPQVFRIILEHLEQDVVEDIPDGVLEIVLGRKFGHMLAHHLEDLGHGPGRIEIVLQGALNGGGLSLGLGGEILLGLRFQQFAHALRDKRLGIARGDEPVNDQDGGGGQQTGARGQSHLKSDRFDFHDDLLTLQDHIKTSAVRLMRLFCTGTWEETVKGDAPWAGITIPNCFLGVTQRGISSRPKKKEGSLNLTYYILK